MADKTFQEAMKELTAPIAIRWRVKTFYNQNVRDRRDLKVGRLPEGTMGQFLPYIDARDVFNRLDEVVGPGNWNDDFENLGNDTVKTTLTVTVDGQTKSASDVGYPGRGEDGQALKAAVSDGIKRAAVHFGIGRFLYTVEPIWVSVDKNGRPTQALPTGVENIGTRDQTAGKPVASTSAAKAPARPTTSSAEAPATTPTPTQSKSGRNQDTPCEIPGCTIEIWGSKVEETKRQCDGHVICYRHQKDPNWMSLLGDGTSDGRRVNEETGEIVADQDSDPGYVNPDDIPF